jgi:hypothetical protein
MNTQAQNMAEVYIEGVKVFRVVLEESEGRPCRSVPSSRSVALSIVLWWHGVKLQYMPMARMQ